MDTGRIMKTGRGRRGAGVGMCGRRRKEIGEAHLCRDRVTEAEWGLGKGRGDRKMGG